MRLYRVAGFTPTGASALRRGEAQQAITEINVPTDKVGLIHYLNQLASGVYPA